MDLGVLGSDIIEAFEATMSSSLAGIIALYIGLEIAIWVVGQFTGAGEDADLVGDYYEGAFNDLLEGEGEAGNRAFNRSIRDYYDD